MAAKRIPWKKLIVAARQAQKRAYAPYSDFPVGAAVLGSDGRIYPGANLENASFGLTVCAERNAVAAAVLAQATPLTALVVVTKTKVPSSPCGMCRQTLHEFADDLPVQLVGQNGRVEETTLAALLPRAFRL